MTGHAPDAGARGKRWLRYMPLAAVVTCYLLVNLVYGLYPQDLNRVRLPLAFWLIGGAAALLPALAPRAARGTVFLGSTATVGVALFAVPVWAGHGCWSPDQVSLMGMIIVGIIAAAAATGRAGPVLSSLDPGKAGRIAVALAVALATTVAWAWPPGVFAPQLQTAAGGSTGGSGTGDGPEVLWRTTSWGDVLSKLLPMLVQPEATMPRLGSGVGGSALVEVSNLGEATIRDARTGEMLSTLKLSPAPGQTGDSPAYVYQETQSAGDLFLLVAAGRADVYDLAGGRFLFRAEDTWPGQTLLLDDGLVAVHGYGSGLLRRYDRQGNVLWEVALPAPNSAPLDQQIDVNGPDANLPRVQLVRAGAGLVAAGEGGLVGVDSGGTVLWQLGLDLHYPTLLASPDGRTVYASGMVRTADGGGIAPAVVAVSAAAGLELWRETLPATTWAYQWAAVDKGLALAHETVERSPEADPYTEPARRNGATRLLDAATGRALWSLPRPGSLVSGMYAVDGDLLFLGEQSVERHAALTGDLLWSADLGHPVAYYVRPLQAGRALIVQARGFEALDLASGAGLWRYTPAGSGWTALSDGQRFFVSSSRGLSCLDPGSAP